MRMFIVPSGPAIRFTAILQVDLCLCDRLAVNDKPINFMWPLSLVSEVGLENILFYLAHQDFPIVGSTFINLQSNVSSLSSYKCSGIFLNKMIQICVVDGEISQTSSTTIFDLRHIDNYI